MPLNLHLLRIFTAVAERGNISRAAQALHISQPAVTKAIRELEKQSGVLLLERGARGVRLTESGTVLHEHARAIFAAEQVAEDELQALRGLQGGTLRIGASLTIANYFLPPYIAQFQSQHPHLQLRLTNSNTETIERLLLDYKLDVALAEGPVHSERILTRRWRDDELTIVVSPGHPLAGRNDLIAKDLENCRWVVREPGSGTREVIEEAFHSKGFTWKHTLEINSTAAIKQTVASSDELVAFVSSLSAADQIALGKLVVLQVPELQITRPLTYLHLKNRPLGIAARAFEKFITQPL